MLLEDRSGWLSLTKLTDRRLGLPRETRPQIVQNPLQALRRDLADTQDALDRLESKYSWLKGWGTGWKASHYRLSDAEWDSIQADHRALRERATALSKEIGVLRKKRKISMLAHGGS